MRDLARHIETIARAVLGVPNKALSTRSQLRFGSNGSVAVEINGKKAGTWFDHELRQGGGVRDFLRLKGGIADADIDQWLERQGYRDRESFPNGHDHSSSRQHVVKTYVYEDEHGAPLFRVQRWGPKKTFTQESFDGQGGWKTGKGCMEGVRLVPYHLLDLVDAKARANGQPWRVFITEGEKDADKMIAHWGVVATTNPRGASAGKSKWRAEYNRHFVDAHVVILPDNDDTGRAHAQTVAAHLAPVASEVRIVELPGLQEKQDISDWLAAGGTADEFAELVAAAPLFQKTNGPCPYRFKLLDFNEIKLTTTASYLVRNIIPTQGLIVVWGPPKCGKSFWTLDLLFHIALGWEYRGHRVKQGRAIYIGCEGEFAIPARVEAFRQIKIAEGTEEPLPFHLLLTRLGLASDVDQLISDIETQLGAEPPVIIAIDTLNRSIEGSESSDEDMTAYIKAADKLREAFHCAVIVIHHCGVDGTRPRGHTALRGACDAEISVKKDNSGRVITTVEFLKDGPDGELTTG
jgi:hypothetical protein